MKNSYLKSISLVMALLLTLSNGALAMKPSKNSAFKPSKLSTFSVISEDPVCCTKLPLLDRMLLRRKIENLHTLKQPSLFVAPEPEDKQKLNKNLKRISLERLMQEKDYLIITTRQNVALPLILTGMILNKVNFRLYKSDETLWIDMETYLNNKNYFNCLNCIPPLITNETENLSGYLYDFNRKVVEILMTKKRQEEKRRELRLELNKFKNQILRSATNEKLRFLLTHRI